MTAQPSPTPVPHAMSRRAVGAGLLGLAGACASGGSPPRSDGRLLARPGAVPPGGKGRRGMFHVDSIQRAIAWVPPDIDPATPAPFVLLLHGGGGDDESLLRHVLPVARDYGLILLAPRARGWTWDVIDEFRKRDGGIATRFGPDTSRVDASLAALFADHAIDPARCAIAGFSDGASYALSLGPRNGELFSHIMAFSPGGVVPFAAGARPRVFISHGRQDNVLPLANLQGGIAPGFRNSGFDLTVHLFDGFHELRPPDMRAAFDWFLAPA